MKAREISDDERASYPRDPDRVWIFTFGFGHTHPITGESLSRKYVRIRGTVNTSRLEMERRFGRKWAFQYPTAEDAGVERWGLVEYHEPEIKPQDGDCYDDAQAINYEEGEQ